MSVINAVPLLAAAGGDYQISRSVRLRSSASAYFNRTPAGTGNRKTWTMSMWLKRGTLSTYQMPFSCFQSGGGALGWQLNTDNTFDFYQYNAAYQFRLVSTAVFRDPSAWYHFVFVVDTTQATASDRVKVYVNGVQITAFSTATYPTQNTDLIFNYAQNHNIGQYASNNTNYFDGYLTEVNFIDGQALTPSSFGETDAVTGVWKPKRFAGSYGTNGFYLNFSDNSNNTAATIGKDSSGNGNNWTPNNISVTAGVTYDSMLDTPTPYADGGNGRGNYAVLNPVNKSLYQPTISDGNLKVAPTTTQYQNVFSTFAPTSGKWYCEVTVNGTANSANMIGVSSATEQNYLTANSGLVGITASGYGYYIYNGNKYTNGSASAYGNSIASGDVVGIAIDLDNGKVWFSKNGTWQASGDPVAGTNAAFTGLTSSLGFFISSSSYSGGATSFDHNFGQRPFAYTPPTGFKALNTQNLPDSTIKKGGSYFNAVTYTGNGATGQTISGAGFQPDLVWVKSRSAATDNGLQDAVRGVTKDLNSNNTDAEETRASSITAFTSSGFTLGGNDLVYNGSGATYVGWQWKESATAGFDIVTYTGTGVARTVAHSLGVAPSMIIVKDRTTAGTSWQVYHKSLGNTDAVLLNSTGATFASSSYWNNTSPTSSVFTVGTSSFANTNTEAYVAYCWAEVAGYSAFGSYTGNGSTDGPFVYCGFRPRWVMFKKTSATSNWSILDTARDDTNVSDNPLLPNSSAAETTSTSTSGAIADILSNGFKLRGNSGDINDSAATYIFAAFAENPFKNSLAR